MYHSRKLEDRKLGLDATTTLHPVNVGLFVQLPLIVLHAQIKNCWIHKAMLG
jgi:hypothetical protein